MDKNLLIIIGGTFDPIHNGHLRLGVELQLEFPDAEICFMPNACPAHREAPVASAQLRFDMLKLALSDSEKFGLSDVEIKRQGTSYTVDTLSQLRSDFPERPIAWVVGSDAYDGLEKWHQVEQLSRLCHLIVASRPGLAICGHQLDQHGFSATENMQDLAVNFSGLVYKAEIPLLDISSTQIRHLIQTRQQQKDAVRWLVPEKVLNFIFENQLYKSIE
ncbi:MAG TPA: nicotinate-nucleotide adenylyltransferase [Aeromonadales bacterium]|nr:nicotinate-nucleotide adenylyltransferase [Aeromonadales bacterium]